MANILIDETFFIIVVFVPVMMMLGVGFFLGKMGVPKPARELGSAMKKSETVVLLAAPDKHLRIVKTDAGISGALRHKDLDVIPDSRGVLNCYGAQVVIASTENASNVTPEFLDKVQELRKVQKNGGLKELADVTGKKVGNTPEDLGRILFALKDKKDKLERRLKWFARIKAHETTVQELAMEIGLGTESKEYKEFKDDVEKDLLDGGISLKAELEKLDKASNITVVQDGFALKEGVDPQTKKPFMRLIRTVQIGLDEFYYLIPTGSSMNALWTLTRRRIQQDQYERGFNESTGFKWMIIGIVAFFVLMGGGIFIYLSTGK